MSKNIKNDWTPKGIKDLEKGAWDALRETDHCVLLTAGAGAGKTEFLAQKATYLLQTGLCPSPKRILAISFKKDAARNLSERVAMRCSKDQARRFHSMTFDAFSKGLLDRFRAALPKPFNTLKTYQIVTPFQNDYEDFLTRYQHHSVTPREFMSEIAVADLPIKVLLGNELHTALENYWKEFFINKETKSLSFLMINRLVKLLLKENPYIRRALQITYPFVFLDEYQDTTYAQYDLLTTAFSDSNAIFTAVGDDKQRIMGWAGAMENAFAQFEADFNAKRMSLLLNWRSHKDLVSIQHAIAREIDSTVEEMQAQGARDIEGDVSAIWQFQCKHDEREYLAEWSKNEIQAKTVDAHDIVILVRAHPDQVENNIATAFSNRGLRIRNASRLVGNIQIQDLLSEELIAIFLPLLRVATVNRCPDNWTLARQNHLLLEAVDPNDILAQEKSLSKLESFIVELRAALERQEPNHDSAKEIAELILEFIDRTKIRRTFPAYQDERDFKRVWNGFLLLLEECAKYSNDWKKTLDEFEGIGQIPLMTVHKSKGLEFHTMIFYGFDNRTWWSLKPDREEELSAFFVALTRACQRAFFLQCTRRGDSIDWLQKILSKAGVKTIAF